VSIAMATALVFLIYCNATLIALMRNAFSRYLGKISFPLYLTHFAIVLSLTSYEITRVENPFSPASFVLVVTTSIAAAILLADVCARLEGKYLAWIDGLLVRHVMMRAPR
jgi:peptidoglycan/LPS O-acetylase OafA/YrhL